MDRPSQDAKAQADPVPRTAQGDTQGAVGGRAEWDAFAERELRTFLRAYQQIEVTVGPKDADTAVTVHVPAPYMMQSVSVLEDEAATARLKPGHQERLRRVKASRDAARPEIAAFLRQQFYAADGRERNVSKGRASPEDVRGVLQGAVDRRLVSLGPRARGQLYPDSRDLRGWLKRYGIGVDCSGFVQHALNSLLVASCAALGRGRGVQEDTGFVRAGWVYRQVSADLPEADSRFLPVGRPAEARPGDVLVRPGHIRIVVCAAAGAGCGLVLDLAESTSAPGIPYGLSAEETDIGPRLIQVTYPEPEQATGEQMPLLRCAGEEAFRPEAQERQYVLGRCRALECARAAWWG